MADPAAKPTGLKRSRYGAEVAARRDALPRLDARLDRLAVAISWEWGSVAIDAALAMPLRGHLVRSRNLASQ